MRQFSLKNQSSAVYVTYTALAGYLMLVATRLFDAYSSNRNTLPSLIIPLEFMIFLLPAGIYILCNRKKITPYSLHFRRTPLSHIPFIIFSAMTLICTGTLLTIMLCGNNISADSFTLYNTFISRNGSGFLSNVYLVFAYALLPAICEETTYRSLFCSEYERDGVICAITISSLCFGMLHFDLQLLPLYIVSGAILAITMYTSGSVTVPIILHFLYNLSGIYIKPYIISFYINTGSRALFIMLTVTLLLIFAALSCNRAAKIYRQRAEENILTDYPTGLPAGQVLAATGKALISLPFILCLLTFILTVTLI